jgi:modulator of FtsH protease HflK
VKILAGFSALLVLAGLAAVIVLFGLVRVDVGEAAIVLRMGRYARTLDAGLHFHVPLLETVEREPVTDRRIEFGSPAAAAEPSSDPNAPPQPPPDGGPILEPSGEVAEPRMLTGDQNLVDLQFFTEYRVIDLRSYRLKVQEPEAVIAAVVRATMREVVGRSSVDEVLGAGRGEIPEEVRELASARLEELGLGVELTQVGLQNVEPPEEVKPAFDDVTSAVQDRDRLIQDAQRVQAELSQRAGGEAAEVLAKAQASRDSAILIADGESSRFVSLLEKYRLSPGVTRSRLYLEAIEAILPRMDKVILEEGTSDRMLPYLPLGRGGDRP